MPVWRCDAGIAILLALSVYQTIVNEKLPATSDAVPLLGNTQNPFRLHEFPRKGKQEAQLLLW